MRDGQLRGIRTLKRNGMAKRSMEFNEITTEYNMTFYNIRVLKYNVKFNEITTKHHEI
jgi:hypothetical protein